MRPSLSEVAGERLTRLRRPSWLRAATEIGEASSHAFPNPLAFLGRNPREDRRQQLGYPGCRRVEPLLAVRLEDRRHVMFGQSQLALGLVHDNNGRRSGPASRGPPQAEGVEPCHAVPAHERPPQ